MEHPRKRKASQSSPVQDHRCLAEEPPSDLPPPTVEPSTHRPKRPRLSLDAPHRSHTSPSPRRRGSPRPVTQSPSAHEVYPGQQYSLHRGPSAPVASGSSLLSPLESPAASSPVVTGPLQSQFYIPPNLPVITRETLRELDLESILKNPQLRHDLMFDPGLQFRPTTSRRKQVTTDRYWTAVMREVEVGCTCAAWDATGEMVPCRCGSNDPETRSTVKPRSHGKRTRPPTPPPWSDRYYKAYLRAAVEPGFDDAVPSDGTEKEFIADRPSFQISVPSRVTPMLHELVAVIKSVIVPPPLSSPHAAAAAATPPSRIAPPQSSQSASDVQHLLSHFDPSLIERELRRGVFDASGLFGLVGETLKRHCAPMRDRQVDNMMTTANGSKGTRTERAISTMRVCFEILELMKLDIANHQLQHLRPFLATSTPDFEIRIFIERCRRNLLSVRITRTWLQTAWEKVNQRFAAAAPIQVKQEKDDDVAIPITTKPLPDPPSHRIRVHMALIEAITSFVFNPFICPHVSGLAYIFPETLYLDSARVKLLAADAADLTALYMLLMLWRQLVFWNPGNSEDASENQSGGVLPPYRRMTPRLEDWEVDRVKREIWEIGPRRIGNCFLILADNDSAVETSDDREKWKHAMQNVALQIATRAEEARTCTSPGRAPTLVSPAMRKPPSQAALNLMSGWIQTHMRRDSPLAARLRELLKQEVREVVTRLTFMPSACGGSGMSVPGSDGVKAAATAAAIIPGSGGGTAGLEPLMPEIRHLAQRLAKLVLVNIRVYWGLYEGQGFLVEQAQVMT